LSLEAVFAKFKEDLLEWLSAIEYALLIWENNRGHVEYFFRKQPKLLITFSVFPKRDFPPVVRRQKIRDIRLRRILQRKKGVELELISPLIILTEFFRSELDLFSPLVFFNLSIEEMHKIKEQLCALFKATTIEDLLLVLFATRTLVKKMWSEEMTRKFLEEGDLKKIFPAWVYERIRELAKEVEKFNGGKYLDETMFAECLAKRSRIIIRVTNTIFKPAESFVSSLYFEFRRGTGIVTWFSSRYLIHNVGDRNNPEYIGLRFTLKEFLDIISPILQKYSDYLVFDETVSNELKIEFKRGKGFEVLYALVSLICFLRGVRDLLTGCADIDIIEDANIVVRGIMRHTILRFDWELFFALSNACKHFFQKLYWKVEPDKRYSKLEAVMRVLFSTCRKMIESGAPIERVINTWLVTLTVI